MAAEKNDDLWRISYQDKDYVLHSSDITVGVLRQIKQKFGAQYGKYLTFVQLLMEGDADAWCCALWIVQRAAGEKPRPPEMMDFAVSELMMSKDDDGEDEDESTPEPDVESGPTVEPPQSGEVTPV